MLITDFAVTDFADLDMRNKAVAQWEAYVKRADEFHAAIEAGADETTLANLLALADAALGTYESDPNPPLMIGHDSKVLCCAKSGVPLFESDEMVEDIETQELFLRSALGLPPRPKEVEAQADFQEEAVR